MKNYYPGINRISKKNLERLIKGISASEDISLIEDDIPTGDISKYPINWKEFKKNTRLIGKAFTKI